jgi:hypothetical protein
MGINRRITALVLGIVLTGSVACHFSVSTANLSSLKLGKDKGVTEETTSFATGDTIYAIATVSNAPGKVSLKGGVSVEDVPGQDVGPIPSLQLAKDLDGSGSMTFTFSPPADGWPKGKYKFDVVMLNENGEQKDQKTVSFTVA